MAVVTWTYSDWITYAVGNATRLSRLRLHIQEVSDKISAGNYSIENKAHDFGFLTTYLKSLLDLEPLEAGVSGIASGTHSPFTRGRALP